MKRCLNVLVVVLAMLSGRTQAQTFNLLHYFGSANGTYPYPPLFLATNNLLYGTVTHGGASGFGGIYSIKPDGTGYTNFFSFSGGVNGAYPYCKLIMASNMLFGTAQYGGSGAGLGGIVFAVKPDGSGFVKLHNFAGTSDGSAPGAGLTLSGQTLYGTTQNGGSLGSGVIFAVNMDSTGFTNMHNFAGYPYDGDTPQGALTLNGNVLYGTAELGGTNNSGTLFSITTNGLAFTNFFAFQGNTNDGSAPQAELLPAGGKLYSTTSGSGKYNGGTAFAVNPDGSGFVDLHDFNPGTDGSGSSGGLALLGSTLYGDTTAGGPGGNGTVFSMSTAGASFTVLHNFSAIPVGVTNGDGAYPASTLVVYSNTVYGTAALGGTNGVGTVYSINLPVGVILSIIRAGTNVILTWPNSGYNLQFNTNLVSTAWSNATPSAVLVNGLYTVTNGISGAKRFYRLSQ